MKHLCLGFAALFGALVLAPSAQALSCMQPDIQRELTTAIESEKVYHILVGRFISPQKPKNQLAPPHSNGDLIHMPPDNSYKVQGVFTGYSLAKTPASDVKLVNYPVQIETICAGPWCGDVPGRDDVLIAFVEAQNGGPPLLRRGPCPHMSHAYSADKEAILREGL